MSEKPYVPFGEPSAFTIITCTSISHQSLSQPSQSIVPSVERPGFTTITIPIDALAAPHLMPFLHTHGVTTEAVGARQTYLARLPSGKRRIRTFRMYQITFPKGTRRLDGLSTRWLVPFTLVFPDGASLKGHINSIPDPEEILLSLPTEAQDLRPAVSS